MLKALWFFIQIGVIAGGAIWLVNRQGRVSIDILDYTIGMQTGHFLLAIFVVFFIFISLYRLVRGVLSLPGAVSHLREKDKRVRGMKALTKGLVAVAAGDAKKATQFSKQTQQYLPKQKGLATLLAAQAARMRGEEGKAKTKFEELLNDKDTAFLGIRGLLKHAVEQNDYETALDYAQQANKLHPKQAWIQEGLYDLQVRNKQWQEALNTLKQLVKQKKVSAEQAVSDQVALYHALYDDHKRIDSVAAQKYLNHAYKLDASFTPSVDYLIKAALEKNQKSKALKLLKKAWKEKAHPDLLIYWEKLTPVSKKKQAEKTMKWYEDLVALNPQSAEGQMAAAKAAMELQMWGEAKAYLKMAERLMPTASLYKLLAMVEKNSSDNEEGVHHCLEKAGAALPDKVWVCSDTGMIYESWEPVAEPHGSFNSIVWDYPHARQSARQGLRQGIGGISKSENALLIDPAA